MISKNKPRVITIIGGKGKMGSLFAKAFINEGYQVFVTGSKDEDKKIGYVQKSDVVIVTVPIRITPQVISDLIPYMKEGSMITDFTSVKVNPIFSMRKGGAKNIEIVGGHPLFGPSTGFKNQNFILCKEKEGQYYDWYKGFLGNLGLKVIEMSANEHDKSMAVVQCLTHISNISLGSTLTNLDCDLKTIEDISTPVYLMRIFNVGRILAQDPDLYADIQIENPYSKEVSKCYFESVKRLHEVVSNGDRNSFKNIFEESKLFFKNYLERSMTETDKLINTIKNE